MEFKNGDMVQLSGFDFQINPEAFYFTIDNKNFFAKAEFEDSEDPYSPARILFNETHQEIKNRFIPITTFIYKISTPEFEGYKVIDTGKRLLFIFGISYEVEECPQAVFEFDHSLTQL